MSWMLAEFGGNRCAGTALRLRLTALLTEVGGRVTYPWLQRILVVDVPVETQRLRLIQRDGIDAPLAERMIAAQATREQRLAIADDVIVNAGSLDDLQRHLAILDAQYRRYAQLHGT